MSSVFLVNHEYELNEGEDEIKRIGIYSSEAEAKNAIERLRQQPGFRDRQDCFVIHRYDIDKDYWTEGYDNSGETA
ncbi:SPOR domain-containing protein [Nocardia sp. NPDC088792]|uniref:SPOR domain-containing protein n=1 Tax=Nocardia sp. NPDC088792 TaxID=3364332 RepID=UPI00381D6B0E